MSVFSQIIETCVADDPECKGYKIVASKLTTEGQAPGAIADLQHKVEGAIRTFKFLAQKISSTYDTNSATDRAKIASIENHLATLESMKIDLVDPILKGLGHAQE